MISGIATGRLVRAIGSVVLLVASAGAQVPDERPPLISRPASVVLIKPGQMSLSPDGDRVAISDQFGNSIQVIDSRGALIWSASQAIALNQPVAVAFAGSGELLFSQWESLQIFRVNEKWPSVIDTVADLSAFIGPGSRICKLYRRADQSWLILASNPDRLFSFDSNFSNPQILIKGGGSKGKLDRPVACAQASSGRIVVAGRGHFPIQIFDPLGKFVVSADWNNATPAASWEAAAVAIDQRETIWAVDATNMQFRCYDPTGTLTSVRSIASGNRFPSDMAITVDHQLLVSDASGRIDIYDLTQED